MEFSPVFWGLVPILLAIAAFGINLVYRRWRRRRILQRPFPNAWSGYLQQRVPVYGRLSDPERERLHQMIHVFLQEKSFYGCAGLEITDEIRVSIAAQACLLSLGRNAALYPALQAILVYPNAFIARRDVYGEDGIVEDNEHHLLGESWNNGRVILSWDDVEAGGSNFHDGHNVVLHEFAHQLDSASGATNGAPPLWRNSYQTWATVFSDNFEDLRKRVDRGQPTVMDAYGTTNEAEFFAVATETFFERPQELLEHRPELFQELEAYYKLDPRAWQ